MANNVMVKLAGSPTKVLDNVETLQDVIDQLDLDEDTSFKVDGRARGNDHVLEDKAFITIGEAVKGGSL